MKRAQIETFDPQGNLTSLVESYMNLNYTRGIQSPGDFTIQLKVLTNRSVFFVVDGMIRINKNPKKCGIITTITKTVDETGKGGMLLTVKGKELWSVFDRRIITTGTGTVNYLQQAAVETIMKALVKSQMGSTASANRQVTGLTIGTDLARGPQYVISTYGTGLLEELMKAAVASGIGIYVSLSSSIPATWTVETIHGVDRRTSQSVNPQALFSSDLGTVKSAEVSESTQAYKNLIYVGGQGEAALRNVRAVFDTSEPTGASRREAYRDQRNLDTNAKLDQAGADTLAANSTTVFIDSKALAFSRLKYETDFDLGDQVTVKEFGITQDGRVIAVTESWQNGLYQIDLVFDKEKPRLDKQIQKQTQAINQTLNAIPATVQTSAPTASTAVVRDSAGRTQAVDPAVAADVATKGYVDSAVGSPVGLLPLLGSSANYNNNTTDPTNDIDVTSIHMVDTTTAKVLTLASTMTKRLDATWVAGTGNGGLLTGTKANSTWYALWIIQKADGTTDWGFDPSASAPTMPTDYIYKARFGWVRTDGAGAILAFKRTGNRTMWAASSIDLNSTGAITRTPVTIQAPPNSIAVMQNDLAMVGSINYIWIRDFNFVDIAPSTTVFDLVAETGGYHNASEMEILVNGSSQVYYRQQTLSYWTRFMTKGFVDDLSLGMSTPQAVSTIDTVQASGPVQGLSLANNISTPTTHIDIAAGVVLDVGYSSTILLPSGITKSLGSAWAVGTGNGGLDTGTKSTATWYAVWVIKRIDTGVVDVLFSLSASAPTMPANYTLKRRIGWVRTDGSGYILRFTQAGRRVEWKVSPQDRSSATAAVANTWTLQTVTAPPNSVMLGNILCLPVTSGVGYWLFRSTSFTGAGAIPVASIALSDTWSATTSYGICANQIVLDGNSQFKFTGTNFSIGTFQLNTLGYIDSI